MRGFHAPPVRPYMLFNTNNLRPPVCSDILYYWRPKAQYFLDPGLGLGGIRVLFVHVFAYEQNKNHRRSPAQRFAPSVNKADGRMPHRKRDWFKKVYN